MISATTALTIKQPPRPVSDLLTSAVLLHKQGNLDQAETLYLDLLKEAPRHADALQYLGMLNAQKGQTESAIGYLQEALAISPQHFPALSNLGKTLIDLHRFEPALSQFDQALQVRSDSAQIWHSRGNALVGLRRYNDACQSYRRALENKPDFVEAHINLATTLKDLGQLDGAVVSFRRALEIMPDFAELHANLAATLRDSGQLDGAVASFQRALELKPDFAELHANLAATLRDLGQFDGALACYHRALELKPDSAEAHSNLGITLRDLGQLDEAVASFQRALELKPDYAKAHINLGALWQERGQLNRAVASYRRALEIETDLAEAHHALLFGLNYLPEQPAALLLAEAQRFGDLVARQARPYTDWPNVPETDRCLRVGLVSGDLRNHPVGYFIEGMLAALATDVAVRLEFIAYPTHFLTDALSERIKACCHGWHSAVGVSDENLARRIREDGIDILIDLSGHTNHNRLPMFAWKPAPVQVSWLGYFATTGIAAIDYLIADPWALPEAEDSNFTEKIQRLPETYLCFTPPDMDVQVASLPALATDHITFGCFNHLAKMNDAVVALWSRTLRAVPQSRLFLKTKQLDDASVRQSVMERFAIHGIGAERLTLEGPSPRAELLAAYQRVDIALDPFPYPGGTTSAEALWMGVPVLTLAGDCFLSHIGESILQNAGLPEWVATDADDYVARAVSHAGDRQRLNTLRNQLRQQVLASPLFDAPRFARHFEAALRETWTHWCNQQQTQ